MDKAELKELIKSGEAKTSFFVIKTSPKFYGELLCEVDTLKEAREEQNANKGKTVIMKNSIKIMK